MYLRSSGKVSDITFSFKHCFTTESSFIKRYFLKFNSRTLVSNLLTIYRVGRVLLFLMSAAPKSRPEQVYLRNVYFQMIPHEERRRGLTISH